MAPEVVLGTKYSEKVDIYSYGILMWQVFTGHVPFDGLTEETFRRNVVLNGDRPPLSKDGKELMPIEIGAVLERCWDNDQYQRIAASEVLEIMRNAQNQLSKPLPANRPASSSWPSSSWLTWGGK